MQRRQREAPGDRALAQASARLGALRRAWREVAPSAQLRETAFRFVRAYPLRAADTLQLAAAINAAGRQPGPLSFVSLDRRLNTAASAKGFPIALPS